MSRGALDREVAELLRDDPDLLAIADAIVATQGAVAPRTRRSVVPAQGRRRLRLAAAVGIPAAAAAVGLLLAAPWEHGPGALTPAQAAVVLRRVAAAASPQPGRVFHQRTVTLTPGRPRLVQDAWREEASPYRFRVVSRRADGSAPVEIGGTGRPRSVFVYDGTTRKLYANPPEIPLRPGRYLDQASLLRDQLNGERPLPRGGRWKVEERTTIDGRGVYKLALVLPPPVGYVGLTYYADAKTYVPVRIVSGTAGASGRQVTDVSVYEYLPSTAATVKLADIRAQHAQAPVEPGSQLPGSALARLGVR